MATAFIGATAAPGPAEPLQRPTEDETTRTVRPGPGDPTSATRGRADHLFQVCPVDRPRHYVDDFGAARWFGGFHRHQGIDIFAPLGTPIRAPFDGRTESSISSAGGIQVYLYGDRGFAFNAHLSRVGRQGKVAAGDVIGYVGNSGDARGGSTHDHFEWHPDGGPAEGSFKLLNAACRSLPDRKEAPPARTPI